MSLHWLSCLCSDSWVSQSVSPFLAWVFCLTVDSPYKKDGRNEFILISLSSQKRTWRCLSSPRREKVSLWLLDRYAHSWHPGPSGCGSCSLLSSLDLHPLSLTGSPKGTKKPGLISIQPWSHLCLHPLLVWPSQNRLAILSLGSDLLEPLPQPRLSWLPGSDRLTRWFLQPPSFWQVFPPAASPLLVHSIPNS